MDAPLPIGALFRPALSGLTYLYDRTYRRWWKYRQVSGDYHEAPPSKRRIHIKYQIIFTSLNDGAMA